MKIVMTDRKKFRVKAGLLLLMAAAMVLKGLPAHARPAEDVFRILDTATGEILQVDGREFLYGAVPAEMTVTMHEEALRAQAAACYAFYSWKRARPEAETYDFTCDSSRKRVYIPRGERQRLWGEQFSSYMEILDRVVDGVYGQCLTYRGEPACAAYFAISSGKTENGADIWGGDLPYLRAAASPGDAFAAGFMTQKTVTAEELCTALGCENLSGAAVEERTVSGSVLRFGAGGKEWTGAEVRAALDLRSACFSVEQAGESYVFTVRGWGHGVGMSQAGANAMAENGASWQEILSWYYPGTELRPV